MGKALTATTISPHEFCSNTTPKGGAITDCTTLVLALFTSNDAAAMLSGGSSSTSTSRTIAVLVSAATCFASSSADSAASPEETPPTSLSSAESVSSASLLDTREPRSACARRARGGDTAYPPYRRARTRPRAHTRSAIHLGKTSVATPNQLRHFAKSENHRKRSTFRGGRAARRHA